jgi:Cu-processing system permease protein
MIQSHRFPPVHEIELSPITATVRRAPQSSGMRQIKLIAFKEFNDRFRSGWVIACVMVWLGAIGLTSFLGLLQIGRIGMQGYERTVISLLNLVQYLVPLLGLLLGHDLIVGESEAGTIRLVLAAETSRTRLLFGKFLGGSMTLAVPLVVGFIVAGTVIGLTVKDSSILPFLRLAVSALVLGILFVAIGLAISTFCRTRVQALVVALLVWCIAVFVFDLVALGVLVSTRIPAAAREIELICDANHINAAADIHSSFDNVTETRHRDVASTPIPSLGWLALNPVDLFRVVNLSRQFELQVPPFIPIASVTAWLIATLGASLCKLRLTDL